MALPLSGGALARLAFLVAALVATVSHVRARDLHAHPAAPACDLTNRQVSAIGREIVAKDAQATYVEYHGDEARKLIGAINSVAPVSHWDADAIVAIDPDGEQPFRVAIIVSGCATHAFPVPRGIWPGVVAQALGSKS